MLECFLGLGGAGRESETVGMIQMQRQAELEANGRESRRRWVGNGQKGEQAPERRGTEKVGSCGLQQDDKESFSMATKLPKFSALLSSLQADTFSNSLCNNECGKFSLGCAEETSRSHLKYATKQDA